MRVIFPVKNKHPNGWFTQTQTSAIDAGFISKDICLSSCTAEGIFKPLHIISFCETLRMDICFKEDTFMQQRIIAVVAAHILRNRTLTPTIRLASRLKFVNQRHPGFLSRTQRKFEKARRWFGNTVNVFG